MSGRKIEELLTKRHRSRRRGSVPDAEAEADRKALGRLMSHAARQSRWTAVLRSVLPEEQAQHFSVADVHGQHMTIHASNSAWATRLRFETPELLSKLQNLREFARVADIRIRSLSQRDAVPSTAADESTFCSPPPEALLNDLADHTEYRELRDAILRLARHGEGADPGGDEGEK